MTNTDIPPTSGISPKVVSAAAAAAATTIIAYLIRQFSGVDVPADVQGAFTVLLTFAAGYFTPDNRTLPPASQ